MEPFRTINSMKAEMKILKKGVEVVGSSQFDRERQAKVKEHKTPKLKGVHDTKELENFLRHFEN